MTREKVLSVTLADCDVQTKRGSGAGGQNRNKRDTAVRIVHRASGAVGECQEERSQLQNKKVAFRRMSETPTFQAWVRRQVGETTLAEVAVSESMREHNIKTEVLEEGEWVEKSVPALNWWKEQG